MSQGEPLAVLYPVAALAGLTFAVLTLVPFQRFRAAARRQVTARDFALGESERVPPDARLANRNLMNLLEMPVLFYVACLTAYVTQSVSAALLALAWLYVALRLAHSLVHLTYNNVFHRLSAYAASNLVLLVLWIDLFRALLGK
jgi:hypothetical protein